MQPDDVVARTQAKLLPARRAHGEPRAGRGTEALARNAVDAPEPVPDVPRAKPPAPHLRAPLPRDVGEAARRWTRAPVREQEVDDLPQRVLGAEDPAVRVVVDDRRDRRAEAL